MCRLSRRQMLWLGPLLLGTAQVPAVAAQMAASRRLVCVGGALTEIIYALGAGGELVGVDTTSRYPATARQLPNVGYARALSAEGVLTLAPTQLIATEDAGPPAVLRQIGQAGVPVTVLPSHHRFEGLLDQVRQVGTLTGRSAAAQQLQQSLQAEWLQTQTQINQRRSPPQRVLFILSHSPSQIMVAGNDTAADAMITLAGAYNAVEGIRGYKPLTPEAVIAARPDVILLTDLGAQALGGPQAVFKLSGLAQTPAGKARRVVVHEAMFLLGFGPRLPQAVRQLHASLHAAMTV
ncbi:heme/hemin ABC transporter substrate-binding protein [Parachitinimonas caeni]|uniref:ABC transporter substrate-binding protein n=1 Tax=Parachitinimonas caeni TaxID=3031301 RepID=A0ABT7DV19_9NEIS|nr:ABC transporter substrate-binding protein [Parachitinimonas caeni]MDK2122980.1 ABC transporter substrate-binding protein [Parachitinimonas caeni]